MPGVGILFGLISLINYSIVSSLINFFACPSYSKSEQHKCATESFDQPKSEGHQVDCRRKRTAHCVDVQTVSSLKLSLDWSLKQTLIH